MVPAIYIAIYLLINHNDLDFSATAREWVGSPPLNKIAPGRDSIIAPRVEQLVHSVATRILLLLDRREA